MENCSSKSPQAALWLISCKLKGLSELLSNYHGERPGVDLESSFYGIGQIILEVADELSKILDEFNASA